MIATLPPIIGYAFPAKYVSTYQKQLRENKKGVRCYGKEPVSMKDGTTGYQYIYCNSELNSALVWIFKVNQKTGRVYVVALA